MNVAQAMKIIKMASLIIHLDDDINKDVFLRHPKSSSLLERRGSLVEFPFILTKKSRTVSN